MLTTTGLLLIYCRAKTILAAVMRKKPVDWDIARDMNGLRIMDTVVDLILYPVSQERAGFCV
jgi:hypothetical protein